MFTLFTTCRAFNPPYNTIQRRALRSWTWMEPEPEIIVLGNEAGVVDLVREYGLRQVADIPYTVHDRPDLAGLFAAAASAATYDVLCYANADLLLPASLPSAVAAVRAHFDRFLVTGQRWNIDWTDDGAMVWTPFVRTGMDYFVFRRGMFTGLATGLGIGHLAWDNYLPWYAVYRDGAAFVDASAYLPVGHLNHPVPDYGEHQAAQANHHIVRNQDGAHPGVFCGLVLDDADYVMTADGSIKARARTVA